MSIDREPTGGKIIAQTLDDLRSQLALETGLADDNPQLKNATRLLVGYKEEPGSKEPGLDFDSLTAQKVNRGWVLTARKGERIVRIIITDDSLRHTAGEFREHTLDQANLLARHFQVDDASAFS